MKDLMVLLAGGFEEIEALTVVDLFRRADLNVKLVSVDGSRTVVGAHEIEVVADKTLDEVNIDDYRALYIPGGQPGATNLMNNKKVVECVNIFKESDKIVAAICAGPQVLDKAEVIKDNKFTCYPGVENRLKVKNPVDAAVYQDENIITSMGPSTAILLAIELLKILASEEKAKEVADDVLLHKLKEFLK